MLLEVCIMQFSLIYASFSAHDKVAPWIGKTTIIYCKVTGVLLINNGSTSGEVPKNTVIFLEFFPNVAPPPTLLGTPYLINEIGLFCILGPREHLFLKTKFLGGIFTQFLGNRWGPPS